MLIGSKSTFEKVRKRFRVNNFIKVLH